MTATVRSSEFYVNYSLLMIQVSGPPQGNGASHEGGSEESNDGAAGSQDKAPASSSRQQSLQSNSSSQSLSRQSWEQNNMLSQDHRGVKRSHEVDEVVTDWLPHIASTESLTKKV